MASSAVAVSTRLMAQKLKLSKPVDERPLEEWAPIAVEFLGAMLALVKQDVFWWLPVALIAAREIAISMYRSMAGRQGITIPARRGAKVKTVCQQFAVGFALLPWSADDRWLWNSFLWIAVVLTLLTGAQYLLDSRRVARSQLA